MPFYYVSDNIIKVTNFRRFFSILTLIALLTAKEGVLNPNLHHIP